MSLKKAAKDLKRRKKKAPHFSAKSSDHLEFSMSNYGDIWFGFKTELACLLHSPDHPTNVCMVAIVDAKSVPPFELYYPNRFKLGDWYVTNAPFGNPDLAGPFPSAEEAKEYGRAQWGAEFYKAALGMSYGN